MKRKTDTVSTLIFQNLQRTQIWGAASLISHPSSEDPNGAPVILPWSQVIVPGYFILTFVRIFTPAGIRKKSRSAGIWVIAI